MYELQVARSLAYVLIISLPAFAAVYYRRGLQQTEQKMSKTGCLAHFLFGLEECEMVYVLAQLLKARERKPCSYVMLGVATCHMPATPSPVVWPAPVSPEKV